MAVTDYQSEQAAIMARLNSQWSGATDIAWPNTKYEPNGSAYIEPFVNRQEAFNTDIGTQKTIRHPGLLTVNVRAPLNKGDGAALNLADDLVAIFRNVSFDGLSFRAPTVRDFGADGPWYRVQVDCPFWRDSVH